ncbi:MAG: hypothetical protein ACYDHP_02160 [Ferrimicrobium sp.]
MRERTVEPPCRGGLGHPGGWYLLALLVGTSLLLAACHKRSSTNQATSTTISGVGTPHRALPIGAAPLRRPFLLFVMDCKGRSTNVKFYLNVSKTDSQNEFVQAFTCPSSITRSPERFWVKRSSLTNDRVLLYVANPRSSWRLSVSGVAHAPHAPMIAHVPPPLPSHRYIPPIPVGLPKSAPSCSADNLVASVQDSIPNPPQGAFLSALITLRVSSAIPCSLKGYPTVVLDGTSGVAERLTPANTNTLFFPLTRPLSNSLRRPQSIVIVKRGVQNAEVPISLPLLCGPDFTSSPLTPYIGVTVTLPDGGGSLTVPGRDFVDRATPVGYRFSSCGQGNVYPFEPSNLFEYATNLGPPGS